MWFFLKIPGKRRRLGVEVPGVFKKGPFNLIAQQSNQLENTPFQCRFIIAVSVLLYFTVVRLPFQLRFSSVSVVWQLVVWQIKLKLHPHHRKDRTAEFSVIHDSKAVDRGSRESTRVVY